MWAAVIVAALALVGCGCGRRNPVLIKISDNNNTIEIRKGRYFSRLERVYGSQIMAQLVNETMVELYAKKIGVMPSDEEVNNEIEELKKVTPNLEESLMRQNMHIDEWKRRAEIEMIERRIRTKDVQVSDDEVKQFYDQVVNAKLSPFYTYATIELFMMRFNTKDEAEKAYKDLEDGARWADVAQRHLAEAPDDVRQRALNPTTWRIDDNGIFTTMQVMSGPVRVQLFGEKANMDLVLNTPVDKYTKPISSSANSKVVWGIVMVNDKTKAKVLSFDKAKYIARNAALERKALQDGKSQEARQAFEKFSRTVNVQPFDPRFAGLKQAGGTQEEGAKPEAKPEAKKGAKGGNGG
jgi:parvulin-like peptidyl-prolyl isomerase